MAKISACIISFNEEKKIEDCLKSLLGIADEIIIVDSFSTDNTVEIAKKYSKNIFQQEFPGYGRQKNFATSKASHEWVINLDCDERLSEELRQSILAIKDSIDTADAWYMTRRTYYIYRWLNHCWYPDKKIRLYNKNKTQWSNAEVHESICTKDLKIKTLSGDILHFSFDSISDHLRTIDKFTEIGADELIANNKSFNVLSPLSHGFWTFIKLYLFKRGFMDGYAGFTVSVLSFMHVFIKYSKAIIKRKQNNSL